MFSRIYSNNLRRSKTLSGINELTRNYLIKASNKNPAFRCFQEEEEECIGNKWVKSATGIRKSRNYLLEEK